MAVYQSQLSHAQRQIPVRTGFRLVNQDAARTVHGLDGKISIVNNRCVHVFFVVIPVAGGLPEMAA